MTMSKQQVHELIERIDGPALIAYWFNDEAASEYGEGTHTYDWHQHLRGQFFCIESGLVQVHTRNMVPGCCRRIVPAGCRRASSTRSPSAVR
jgi:hypothetical protein